MARCAAMMPRITRMTMTTILSDDMWTSPLVYVVHTICTLCKLHMEETGQEYRILSINNIVYVINNVRYGETAGFDWLGAV